MVCVPAIELNNGLEMPAIGLGTYTAESDITVNVVKAAIDCGYRHFDTALLYRTEKIIGEAIRGKISEGTVRREEVFIVSKLWNTFHRPDLVVKGCKKTLKNLGLDYIDSYLMHWPMAFKATERAEISDDDNTKFNSILENPEYFPVDSDGKIITSDEDYLDTWSEMEKCVDLGLVKSIGVSNFNSVQIDRLMKNSRIKPVTNQIECHPYLNQKKLIKFCTERNVVITAYGPLGLQVPTYGSKLPKPIENPTIISLARNIGRTPAQLILRYLVQVQSNTIPIPKTSNVNRLKENISIFDFSLTTDQMEIMDSLNFNFRICVVPGMESMRHYPFGIEF